MKSTIKKVWEFVKKNCEYYDFSVDWDSDNEMLGLRIFKVDDDYTGDYKKQSVIIKKQIEKQFGIVIDNFCEPSDWEVECMDVRRQVYMELDGLLFNCKNWLDYSVEVGDSWNGVFSDDVDYELFF